MCSASGSTGSDSFVFNPDVVVLNPVNVLIFCFFPPSLLIYVCCGHTFVVLKKSIVLLSSFSLIFI